MMAPVRQEEIWDVEAAQQLRHARAPGCSRPAVLEPDRRPPRRTCRRRASARVRHRHRPGRRPARRAGRAASPASSCPARWSTSCAPRSTRRRSRSIRRRHGDAPSPRGRSRLVYLVFNTISNLLSQAAQVACFRNAARHLDTRRPFRDRAVGSRAAEAPTRSAGHGLVLPSPATSGWTPTTSSPARRVPSLPVRGESRRPGCSAASTATSGRPSST